MRTSRNDIKMFNLQLRKLRYRHISLKNRQINNRGKYRLYLSKKPIPIDTVL